MQPKIVGKLGAAAAVCLVQAAVQPALAVEIGSVAAANRDVLGTPPAEATRQLQLGARVVLEERVQTSELGAGQFLFLDQTALTVWPKSDIVLDSYVYDPERGTGDAALSMTRGMLRFIGGRISKSEDVTIRTPHSVIAVRGGIAQVVVTDTTTRVVHIAGEYTKIGDLVLSRPMAVAEVSSNDGRPRFVGIGGAEVVGELYGSSVGTGSGGLTQPPGEGVVNAELGASGLPIVGSSENRVLIDRPISTRGEREPLTEEAQVRVVVDRTNEAAVDSRQPRNAEPPPPPPPPIIVVTPPITGSEPPPPPGPPPVNPSPPVLTGALFRSVDPTGGNRVVTDSAPGETLDAADVFTQAGVDPVVDALTGTTLLDFVNISGSFFFPAAGTLDGRAADALVVVDPGVFAVGTLQTVAGSPSGLALGFLGTPAPTTAPAHFAAVSGPDIVAPVFTLSVHLFSRDFTPLPPQLGSTADGLGPLVLVPEPNAPLLRPYAPGLAADPAATGSKWLLGWFEVDGEGPEQTSALGGMTALVLPTEAGHPSASGDLLYVAQTDASAPPALGRLTLGTLTNLEGITSFGAIGQFAVLGGAGPYATDADPDLDVVDSTYVTLDETGLQTTAYASTRLAELSGYTSVPESTRQPLGGALMQGFATGQGVSFRPGAAEGSRISEPYVVATTAPGGLRISFDAASNGVGVEMSGLRGVSGTGADISSLRLNWGGGDGRDAMLTDAFFVVRETAGTAGPITGQPVRLGADPGRAPTTRYGRDEQTAFAGTLVSHDVVGDGGLLPDGVDATPEYLRWGWWAGEYRHAETDPNVDNAGRMERLGVGAWVAGVQSDLASVLATTGTGTYSGLAIGNVIETTAAGAVAYVDGGRFDMTYNFGARSGSATLTGIADQSLTASITGATAAGGPHYTGTFSCFCGGPGSGSLRGVFYEGAGDPTAATGGSFNFRAVTAAGNPAAVSGVFGADRSGPLTP